MISTPAPPHRALAVSCAAVLLIHAAVFGNLLFAGLGLLWLGLMAFARVQARRAVLGIEVLRTLPVAAHEGDTVPIELSLRCRGGGDRIGVQLAFHFGPEFHADRMLHLPEPLPGRGLRRYRVYGHCTNLWGVYSVGDVLVTAADWLGISRGRARSGTPLRFTVYPRLFEIRGLGRFGGRPGVDPEGCTGLKSGQSQLYLGVREYRGGDDPRHVHWPASARRGELMVRELETELVPWFTLFVDLERNARAGVGRHSTLEYAIRIAASLLSAAQRQGLQLQVLGQSRSPLVVPAGRGEAQLALALDQLVRHRQDGELPIEAVVERSLPLLPPGSSAGVLLSTSTPDAARCASLVPGLVHTLRAHGVEPFFVLIDRESFLPIDEVRLEAGEAESRRVALCAALDAQGVRHLSFGAEQALDTEHFAAELEQV